MSNNKKMFIFLHGYNSCGDAMKILDNSFHLITPKESVFLYPNAPFQVNNSNNYTWFPVILKDDDFDINEEFIFNGMKHTEPYLLKYIENQLKIYNDFNYNDIVFVGFSQGAALALHMSIFAGKPFYGTISFSGGLANPNNIITREKINKCNILLIHGNEDKILPSAFSSRSYKILKKNNFNVEYHLLKNTNHHITPEAIKIAENFITNLK